MNDLVRPASSYTGGIAVSAPGGVLATIPNPPPEIANLPNGTTLRGVVIGTSGKGQVLVKTDQGTLTVAAKAHLPLNSEVVLQIRSSGTLLHIMIMQVRGQSGAPDAPPPSAARPTGLALTPGGGGTAPTAAHQPGAATAGPGHPDRLNLGQVVRAVVQGPPGHTATPYASAEGVAAAIKTLTGTPAGQNPRPGPGLNQQPVPGLNQQTVPGLNQQPLAGAILPLRILSVSTPGPAPGATAPPVPGPAVSSTQGARAYAPPGPLMPNSAPSAPGAPNFTAPATTAGAAVPNPAAPPAPPQSAAPVAVKPSGESLRAPLTFTGQVTGVSASGHPVLSTPLGSLSLDVEARIPGGSRVALELVPGALPKAAASPLPVARAHSLAHAWPALEEALGILAEASGGAMAGTPQGVPQPGTRLTSGMLFFMAALSGGNLGRWLGADALQALRASGHDTLIGRLSGDLARMGRMAETAGGAGGTAGDWRLLPIPLWSGDHVHQLRLFLRQHEDRGEGDKKSGQKDPKRFILELEMSRLGEIQLDGLIRGKRFDLMMRTRGALPEDMRQDIRTIFEDANQAAGFSGNLGFQASTDWRFLPIGGDSAAGEPPGLLV